MANINTVETESIQAGVAPTPPIATVDLWPSLNPSSPFTLQSTGINNFIALTNQIGLHNGIGMLNQIGLDNVIGFHTKVGGEVDVEPNIEIAAPSVEISSPNGSLLGDWDLNGLPVCASSLCSDVVLKTNIKPLENSLDKVLKLQGVSFDWKKELVPSLVKLEGESQVGLIAQEVEEVEPTLVGNIRVEGNDVKGVKYQNLTALLVEAIKEQQEQINSLKETVQELSTKLAECCS